MKKILSGPMFMLFLLILYLCGEIGCVLLCIFADTEKMLLYGLLVIWSIMFSIVLLVANRTITIVTYDLKRELVTRRGLFWGFYREVRVADIVRTEVRRIPKEQEYIFLLEKNVEHNLYDSLSPDMPIRVLNTAKGRAFVEFFYKSTGDGSVC